MFSPYYAWRRRQGVADPMNHCAVNVALYGPRAKLWSMTERGARHVWRDASTLSIGRSAVEWTGDALSISIDEVTAPIPRRIRGRVTLQPAALCSQSYRLDAAGRHSWTPYAPSAHVEVELEEPSLAWKGPAYLDSNTGSEPLEAGFRRWTWSRAPVPDGTVVLYDVSGRPSPAGGGTHCMALHFRTDGSSESLEPPPVVHLPVTGWRIARQTRADPGNPTRLVRTLEDAPFYSRSLLATTLLGNPAPAIHESLDLERFDSRWVQCLLPFRMPRRSF